jgi:hypothetical protein
VTTTHHRHVRVFAFLAAVSVASAAAAQTTGSSRGYRGLFGGSGAQPGARHSLDATLSAVAGYDENTTGTELGQPDTLPTLLQSAFYSGPTGTLTYSFTGSRVQIGANGGSSARYYAEEGKFIPVGHFGAGLREPERQLRALVRICPHAHPG